MDGLKRFLVKYRSKIAIISAAVVFVAFIVKDVFRDRYKDLVDSTKTAETAYNVRSDLLDLERDINGLDRSINQISDRVSVSGTHGLTTYDSLTEFLMQGDQQVLLWDKNQIKITEALSDALPRRSETHSALTSLKDDLAAQQSHLDRLLKKIEEVRNRQLVMSQGKNTQINVPQPLRLELAEIADQTKPLAEKVNSLKDEVLQYATELAEERESSNRIATDIQWALVSLGFLLTVAGQLVGTRESVESVGGE